ncbi:MAG: hypothetical protein F2518_10925 [Actinobacteria bacterium]|nr:hypothetical protein [Actinomycetota bacterium]MTA64855.1 hypothetical protein [Actinomycetota bacterium]
MDTRNGWRGHGVRSTLTCPDSFAQLAVTRQFRVGRSPEHVGGLASFGQAVGVVSGF